MVNDIKFPASLGEPYTRYQSYRPMAQTPWRSVNVVMRTSATPESLSGSLRRTVAEIDSTIPVYRIRTAASLARQTLGNISLLGSLLGAFAALGLALASIGIYGVISYSVVQRTGEIGIRMALGAQTRDVLRLVLGKGVRLTMLGVILGLGGAYAVSRFLSSAIPTLPTRDPLVMAGIALALIVVALAACYFPSRRATKVDPSDRVAPRMIRHRSLGAPLIPIAL